MSESSGFEYQISCAASTRVALPTHRGLYPSVGS